MATKGNILRGKHEAPSASQPYIPPKRKGKKSVGSAWLDEDMAQKFTECAAGMLMRPTDYLAEIVLAHIEANPGLVAKGRAILASGQPLPYRTTRMALEEENKLLKEQLARTKRLKPAPK